MRILQSFTRIQCLCLGGGMGSKAWIVCFSIPLRRIFDTKYGGPRAKGRRLAIDTTPALFPIQWLFSEASIIIQLDLTTCIYSNFLTDNEPKLKVKYMFPVPALFIDWQPWKTFWFWSEALMEKKRMMVMLFLFITHKTRKHWTKKQNNQFICLSNRKSSSSSVPITISLKWIFKLNLMMMRRTINKR